MDDKLKDFIREVIERKKNTGRMFPKISKCKCSVCGKEILVPNPTEKERTIFNPYCCSTVVLVVQYLIHEGWHIRNLGVTDNHPYFCPDCWKKGTPEYSKAPYNEEWYKQAKEWMED